MKGSYILILQLEQPVTALGIGRLGSFDFAAGYYLYIGSAHGPGGLEARIAHHERRHKARPHWHIDYLRAETLLREAWLVTSPAALEGPWCEALAAHPALSIPVRGFGSSDSNCSSHLFYSPRPPHPSLLTTVILGAVVEQSDELRIEIHSFDDV